MRSSLMSTIKLLAVFLLLLVDQGMGWKCDVHQTVCETWLVLEHRLTMMKGKSLIVVKNGLLFAYNAANYSRVNAISKEDVITADGWAEPRVVIAINGTVPGPLIEVHEQQIVRVHVHNKMRSEATTVHFHGQPQRGTPWMDGVSFITQCPLLPGQTFTYQFTAEHPGTYWYHSHTGSQSVMGMHGGFVVHPRQGASSRYHSQFTLLVEDWNHDWDSTMGFMKMQYGMFVHGRKESAAENLSGAKYSMYRCQSGLINGRGRYHDPLTGHHNGAPLETFSVRSGGVYRFRIIHSGSVYPFQLSVDGHKLKVVATDGIELRDPVMADSVIVNTGERYDFELHATHVVDNYWIKAKTLEVGVDHTAEAILHYEGAAEDTDPVTTARQCASSHPCVVVNCPFGYFPAETNTICVNVEQLRSAEKMPHNIGIGVDKVKEYFLNFAFPGTSWTPASVNGVQLKLPTVSALTQPLQFDTRCPGEGYRCAEDEVCHCTSVLDLEEGEVAQFVVTNLGKGAGWDHPIHMHGHSFWVLKVGYPAYDIRTGKILHNNVDIDCRGNPNRNQSFCNNATWADEKWSGNTVPGLELDSPVRKDTVNVPTGGYVIVRIKADNPGVWSMHCHISLHMVDGMFLLLNESYPNHPPPPPGFPQCGNFDVAPPEQRDYYMA